MGAEEVLHRDLVHADRGGEHARAGVGDARQLQQALDRPVLALRAVQENQDDVEALAQARRQPLGGLHAHERGAGVGGGRPLEQLVLGGGVRAALGQGLARRLLGQRAQRVASHEPAAVLGDADGGEIEAAPVHRRHHRRGAREGDLVLARPAAEHHADPQLPGRFRHEFSCIRPRFSGARTPSDGPFTGASAGPATPATWRGGRRSPSRRRDPSAGSTRGPAGRRAGAPGSPGRRGRRARTGSRDRSPGCP